MEGVKTVVALDLTLTELPEICRALLQRIAESESELAEHSDEAVAKLEQQLAANAYRTERGAVLVRVAHPSIKSNMLGVARLREPVHPGAESHRNSINRDHVGVLIKFVLVLLSPSPGAGSKRGSKESPLATPNVTPKPERKGSSLHGGNSESSPTNDEKAAVKRSNSLTRSLTRRLGRNSSDPTPFMLEADLLALFTDDLFLADAYLAVDASGFTTSMKTHLKHRKLAAAQKKREPSIRGDPTKDVFVHPHDGLTRSGKIGGGIRADIARRLNADMYASDWKDGLNLKSIGAGLYMFFACLAPGIAFGASVQAATGGQMGIIEYLLTQGITGIIFALISGQPLVILRPTGPITLFTTQLFLMSELLGVDFLQLNAWVGLWVGIVMICVAMTDTCSLVKACGAFTQDIFGAFVAVIFISMAMTNLIGAFTDAPSLGYDRAFLMVVLAVLTFKLAMALSGMHASAYLTPVMRERLSEFAVPIAILIFAALRMAFPDVDNPMLTLPSSLELTRGPAINHTSLIVPYMGVGPSGGAAAPAWLPFVGLGFGLFLSLLFFVDHNVTSLLTQASENHLRKGNAYHWNFLLVGLFNIFMPMFGCPFVTGSLPHSPQFVQALAIREQVATPGGSTTTRIVYVYENRIAPLITNVLIMVSLFVTPVFAYLPIATLDGLFLFMGASSLPGNAIWQRAKLLFQQKRMHPPDHISRSMPLSKVHSYTLVQIGVIGFLYFLSRTPAALSFPVFVICTIPLRLKLPFLTNGFLSRKNLDALDGNEELPPAADAKDGEAKKKEEDKMKDGGSTHAGSNDSTSSGHAYPVMESIGEPTPNAFPVDAV